jgi:hypothetical protein
MPNRQLQRTFYGCRLNACGNNDIQGVSGTLLSISQKRLMSSPLMRASALTSGIRRRV